MRKFYTLVKAAAIGAVTALVLAGGLAGCASGPGAADQKKAQELSGPSAANQEKAKEWYEKGNTAFDAKNYDRAIADYTQAIELNPKFAGAYYNRGLAFYYKKNYDRAIADYTQAIQLNPEYSEAYYNRGLAYRNKKDYDQAIADFTQAIQLAPENSNAYYNRGYAYAEKKDYDQAIADYTQAIQLNPEYSNAYNNRGLVYAEKKDYDQAIADYEAALRINPEHTNARRNLADIQKKKAAEAKEAKFNPNKFDRSQYKEITVEDFSFDMVAGKFNAGTKISFKAKFLTKPTGMNYRFEDVNSLITFSTTHNFVRDIPDRCFGPYQHAFLGWQSQDSVKIFVTVKKPGQSGECSVDIVEW
jgi:tetratricopeptide (TPR) repeat protein